jgi:hypothetical protein
VVDVSIFANGTESYEMDHPYEGRVVLDLNEISPADVGVELVVTEKGERLISTQEFEYDKSSVDNAVYKASITVAQPGTFSYGIRIYSKNENLPHRQDFNLVKWI